MNNNSNNNNSCKSSPENFIFQELAVLVIYEIFVVIISIAIVSTSSLVIHHITKVQDKKSRSDFIFVILSGSDIIVGLVTVPLNGVYWYFLKENDVSDFLSTAYVFFGDFPYYFSCLITVVIAVDRLFVITIDQKYKNLIKPRILKGIIIAMFGLIVTYSSVCIYFMLPENQNSTTLKSLSFCFYILGLASAGIIILAHLYILYFVWKGSNVKKLSKHCGSKFNGKRLTMTIMYLSFTQCVCIIPYCTLWLIQTFDKVEICHMATTAPWIVLLRNCQGFCNAIILLRNQKQRRISKKSEIELIVIKDRK